MKEETWGNGRSPEQIEGDIKRKRDALGYDIEVMRNELSPGRLIDRAIEYGRRGPGEFGTNLARSVRDNPVPVVLVAIGLFSLLRRAGSEKTEQRISFDETRQQARERMEETKEKLGNAAERVREVTFDSRERLRHSAHELRNYFGASVDELKDNPFLLATMGIAAGALLGSAFPSSEAEREAQGHIEEEVVGPTH